MGVKICPGEDVHDRVAGGGHVRFVAENGFQAAKFRFPGRRDIGADAHHVKNADTGSKWYAAAQKRAFLASFFANKFKTTTQDLSARKRRIVMSAGQGGRVEKIEFKIGKTPVIDHSSDHCAHVFLHLGMGEVEGRTKPVPDEATVDRFAVRFAQKPVGMLLL